MEEVIPTERELLIFRMGNKCVRCGFSDIRALQIDHIRGGGVQDRKKRGNKFYISYLVMDDEDLYKRIQLLCANCNWIKKHEEKEMPYRRSYLPDDFFEVIYS